jgi:hypothetical protein
MKKYFLTLFLILNTLINYAGARDIENIDNMQLVRPIPLNKTIELYGAPMEQRGIEYRKYLSASLKISVNGGAGSGTIVFYDKKTNTAYVASCGHLWQPGTLSSTKAKEKKITCKVTTWYHNEEKLKEPKTYDADLNFYSFVDGCDTSLVSFHPDWEPNYFPIASKDYIYQEGEQVHSLGCDGAKEVAHYNVEIVRIDGGNLVTIRNSPRPGRSGGGLMDNNDYYIGTCWGTTDLDGSGQGFFTPLSVIHEFWSKNGYSWLLVGADAKKIKIVDGKNNKMIDEDLILVPKLAF